MVEQPTHKTVNISNIVEDFKKTLATVGAPKDINEEVATYLKLVDTQSQKETPSPKIIKINLKNASIILDEYISSTLNKPSKVVTEWIDAVFLQNIDYKAEKAVGAADTNKAAEIADKSAIIPEDKASAEAKNVLPQEATREHAPLPQQVETLPVQTKLEKAYRQAGRLVDAGKYDKALVIYDKLLPASQKTGNKNIETQIYFDKAYIYDVNRNFPAALENYNKAARTAAKTGDVKTQALSHYNMASIYDDFGKTDSALKHYYQAIAIDGQGENLKAQTHALNDVGNVFSSMRKYKTAMDNYQVGFSLSRETNDLKGRAFILSNMGSVLETTGKDDKALKCYKESVECDMKTGNTEGCAVTYAMAGDIMSRNNFPEKAEKLYQKSLNAAQKIDDRGFSQKIMEKLRKNNLSY